MDNKGTGTRQHEMMPATRELKNHATAVARVAKQARSAVFTTWYSTVAGRRGTLQKCAEEAVGRNNCKANGARGNPQSGLLIP